MLEVPTGRCDKLAEVGGKWFCQGFDGNKDVSLNFKGTLKLRYIRIEMITRELSKMSLTFTKTFFCHVLTIARVLRLSLK